MRTFWKMQRATSIKFYIIGFVLSCCVHAMSVWLPCSEVCQRNYRPRKFVIVLRWLVDSCVLLGEAWRHVCRSTSCLLLRRQRSSVVCQLSTIVYTRASHIHAVDLPVLRPPDWPCNAGLVSCQRVWSVHCSQPTRTASACHVCIWETVLTEWIALEHGVNLLQQWRHRTSPQNLSFEITLNTWTFIVAM